MIEKTIKTVQQSYDMGQTFFLNTYEILFNTETWESTSNLIKKESMRISLNDKIKQLQEVLL